MLKNYLGVSWHVFIRNRGNYLISIGGLAVGFAACLVLALYVRFELTYENFLSDSETLWRLDTIETVPGQAGAEVAGAPARLARYLAPAFGAIEGVSRALAREVRIDRDGHRIREKAMLADANFFALLGLPLIHGTATALLADTASVVLSERAAVKYFGTTEVVGRTLGLRLPEARPYRVSGVFRDFPANSHLAFDVAIRLDEGVAGDVATSMKNWGDPSFKTYLRLRSGAGIDGIAAGLAKIVDTHFSPALVKMIGIPGSQLYDFRLVPFADIHFDGLPLLAMKDRDSRQTVALFAAVALLVLGIAGANYVNLWNAMAIRRRREMALRMIFGSSRRQIGGQFMTESLLVLVISLALGLMLAEWFVPVIGQMIDKPLPAAALWHPVWLTAYGLVLALLAVTSALYAALVLSAARPGRLLLGGRSERHESGRLRGVLVSLQFAVSIALIITIAVIAGQVRYGETAELGFLRDNVLVMRSAEGPLAPRQVATLMDGLGQIPGVLAVANSGDAPGDIVETNSSFNSPAMAAPVIMGWRLVGPEFFQTYGIEPLAGRLYERARGDDRGPGADGTTGLVVNRSGARRLGFDSPEKALGQVIRSNMGNRLEMRIVGVVPDVHFQSPRKPTKGELMILDADADVLSIRYAAGSRAAVIGAASDLWRQQVGDKTMKLTTLDQDLAEVWQADRRQGRLLGLFAAIAVVLSCLGLVAMTAMAIENRAREAVIRKILGARTHDLIMLFSWQFLKPVIAANVLAWPIAYIAAGHWLEGYVYRIEMPAGAFVIAALGTLAIAWAAIGSQLFALARQRPTEALRNE